MIGMPPQAVSLRPQTSRQAKNAYRKAGGTPRLSAVELRRLERSAELQERAARIKAHNDRARELKRRKAEKLEAKRQKGISEPGKINIGSSQLSLVAFVGAGIKRKREEAECPALPLDSHVKIEVKEEVSEPAESLPACHGSPAKIPSAGIPVTPRTDVLLKKEEDLLETAASLMPPPPPPPPRRPLCEASAFAQTRPESDKRAPPFDIGTDWDALFDSNTQVEREISEQQERPSLVQSSLRTPAVTPAYPQPTSEPDILSCISTQDLEYSSSPPPAKAHVRHEMANRNKILNEVIRVEHMDGMSTKPQRLRKADEISRAEQRRLLSEVTHDDLNVIQAAVLEKYCVHLPHFDIRRILAGQLLTCRPLQYSLIPPQVVIKMVAKVAEMKQGDSTPWNPIRMMPFSVESERMENRQRATVSIKHDAAAGPALTRKSSTSKKSITKITPNEELCVSRTKQEPPSLQQTTARTSLANVSIKCEEERPPETKPFDEFDIFDLSSQDLMELGV